MYRCLLRFILAALLAVLADYPMARADTTSDFYLSDAFETGSIRGVISSSTDTVRSATIRNSDRFAIKVGDDARNRQIKSILSFDTSAIPAGATIFSATLYLTNSSARSINPIAPLERILLEARSGYFGFVPSLEAQDFYAAGGVKAGSSTGATGQVEISISQSALSTINQTGKVQFRLRTKKKTNRDGRKNVATFYSNEARSSTGRPRLRVRFSATSVVPPSPTPSGRPSSIWKPAPGTSWQWQLSGALDTSVVAQMYDIDLVDTSAQTIAALKARGIKVICYFSAGSFEKGRPDSAQFPQSVLGNTLDGYPNERWLDIRQISLLSPIMTKRLDLAASKGCDGVEPDNVDGFSNDSGFPLSGADQLAYNRWLAREAHDRNLSVGLKNDLRQVDKLVDDFDWALNEQCFQYNECSALTPFINRQKAVFGVEYEGQTSTFCPKANQMNFDWLKKNETLDASRVSCR